MVRMRPGGSISLAAVFQEAMTFVERARPRDERDVWGDREGPAAALVAEGVVNQGEQPAGERHAGDLGAPAASRCR